MDASSPKVFGAGLLKAATDRFNLWIAGFTVTGAVVAGSWGAVSACAASYVLVIVLDLCRPGFWGRVGAELRRRPPALPEERELLDDDARELVRRLSGARDERERALGAVSLPGERTSRVLEGAADVERRAVALIAVLDQLGRYLANNDPGRYRAQVHRTAARLTSERGSAAADADRTLALRAGQEGVAALEALQVDREAIAARITALVAALEMLPHRLVRAGITEASARAPVPGAAIGDLEAELAQLEELASAAVEGGSLDVTAALPALSSDVDAQPQPAPR